MSTPAPAPGRGWRRREPAVSLSKCHHLWLRISSILLQLAVRLDFLLHDPHQVRPAPRLLLAHFAEIDDVPMMGMGRRVIDLLAADVGEDPLGIAGVFLDQLVHERNRVDDALGVGVVEGEALSRDLRTQETLVFVGLELGGIVVSAGMEEIGRDERDRATIELVGWVERRQRRREAHRWPWDGGVDRAGSVGLTARNRGSTHPTHVDDAHDHRGLAGPFVAFAGVVDRPAVRANPAQARGSCVALADRIRGDQAEGAPGFRRLKARRKK